MTKHKYTASGGPWDRMSLLLAPPGNTAWFQTVRHFNGASFSFHGRYCPGSNDNSHDYVVWEEFHAIVSSS